MLLLNVLLYLKELNKTKNLNYQVRECFKAVE